MKIYLRTNKQKVYLDTSFWLNKFIKCISLTNLFVFTLPLMKNRSSNFVVKMRKYGLINQNLAVLNPFRVYPISSNRLLNKMNVSSTLRWSGCYFTSFWLNPILGFVMIIKNINNSCSNRSHAENFEKIDYSSKVPIFKSIFEFTKSRKAEESFCFIKI